MSQDLPRIIKGFRTEVFLKAVGLWFVPVGAMAIGAYRYQVPPNQDMIDVLLKMVVLVSGLVWLLALPYLFYFLTPKCDSCKVRTRRYGKLYYEGDEWRVTICPLCRERFMHPMLGE